MAATHKILGQSNPSAATLTDVYTVPALTRAVVSGFFACNRHATAATSFRNSYAVAGAADDLKQYVYYDTPISAVDTFLATTGITLGPGDVARVYAAAAQMSFAFFGTELT